MYCTTCRWLQGNNCNMQKCFCILKNYCNLMAMNVFLWIICTEDGTILSLPSNLTGDGTVAVATFVLAVVTVEFCHLRGILHNTAKVYTIPHCQKCILYHTVKCLYYTILPKVCTIPYCRKCIFYHTVKCLYYTILPKVYTIPHCQQCILYHTAKSVYYTTLPKVYTIPHCQK